MRLVTNVTDRDKQTHNLRVYVCVALYDVGAETLTTCVINRTFTVECCAYSIHFSSNTSIYQVHLLLEMRTTTNYC